MQSSNELTQLERRLITRRNGEIVSALGFCLGVALELRIRGYENWSMASVDLVYVHIRKKDKKGIVFLSAEQKRKVWQRGATRKAVCALAQEKRERNWAAGELSR